MENTIFAVQIKITFILHLFTIFAYLHVTCDGRKHIIHVAHSYHTYTYSNKCLVTTARYTFCEYRSVSFPRVNDYIKGTCQLLPISLTIFLYFTATFFTVLCILNKVILYYEIRLAFVKWHLNLISSNHIRRPTLTNILEWVWQEDGAGRFVKKMPHK